MKNLKFLLLFFLSIASYSQVIEHDFPVMVNSASELTPVGPTTKVLVLDPSTNEMKYTESSNLSTGGGTTPSTGTGTEFDLSNVLGVYYDMNSADSNTTYTYTGEVLGGVAFKLINTSVVPTVTGATRIYKGNDFIANTNMYLVVKYNGNRVEYFFEKVDVDLTQYTGLPYGALITELDSATNIYVGSPFVFESSSGRIFMTHDHSGGSFNKTSVYYSDDLNGSFIFAADVIGIFWTTMFEYSGNLYLLGVSQGTLLHSGDITLSKSTDDGLTWSAPITVLNEISGTEKWHTSSIPVIFKDGYLVKAFEVWDTSVNWAGGFSSTLVLADLSDLENSANWSYLTPVDFNSTAFVNSNIQSAANFVKTPTGGTAAEKGFLEGSIIEKSDGDLRLLLRLEQSPSSNYACYLEVSWNDVTPTSSTISTTHNFISLPGGQLRIAPVYDSVSGKYWAVTNINRYRYMSDNRIEAYLISSDDEGLTWDVYEKTLGYEATIDWESETSQFAVQYTSVLIRGNDLYLATRTADANAANQHDANLLTLTILEKFRDLTPISYGDESLIIDENSARIEDVNGIAIIHDQSKYFNSAFMLNADNANKVSWNAGLDFTGSEYLRIRHDKALSLYDGTGISFFIVVENLQDTSSGLRMLSNDDGVNQQNIAGTGGWWISANAIGLEQRICGFTDLTLNNDYIFGFSIDATNDFIYNYLNGANRGEPSTKTNVTWDTDHAVMSGAYSGTNFKEIFIGKRLIGASPLYFTSKIKAVHIVPKYMTPTEMVAYQDALNAIYSIY